MWSLRDMFGSKSPHTIQKRASTLLRLFRWLQRQADAQGTSVEEPLLPSEEAVYKFCREISHSKKGKRAPQSMVQALKFVKFLLSIPEVENSISPRVRGLADRVAGEHEPTHQARDLTVLQVKFPAEWLGTPSSTLLSDLQQECSCVRSSAGTVGQTSGTCDSWSSTFWKLDPRFVVFWKESFQGRARETKQSNKKKKLSFFMPLVAPVRGSNLRWCGQKNGRRWLPKQG